VRSGDDRVVVSSHFGGQSSQVMEYVDLYDEVFFESRPSPERHVTRLSTLAHLCGLKAPPASHARVLEIGCSTGANLIPMACAFSESTFVGFDISSLQIEVAKGDLEALQLKNIRFLVGDVRQDNLLNEKFDYIICHGVLSWVDPGIQGALLDFVSNHLSSEGVCYLSFNSLPGYKTREVLWNAIAPIRDMGCPPEEKISKAKELLRGMAAALVDAHRPYGMQLKEEIDRNLQRSDGFFVHELLNPFCSAVTLSDLKSQLSKHQLHYLCDSLPLRSPGAWSSFPELEQKIGTVLKEFKDQEQIADYLFPHSFRGALVSLKAGKPLLRDNLGLLEELKLCSPLTPLEEQPDIFSNKTVTFCSPTEQTFDENDILVKSALLVLRGTWPKPISFSELLSSALDLAGLKKPADGQLALLKITLVHYFQGNHLELFREGYPNQIHPSDQPEVLPFARLQILRQDWVTTLRHESLPVDQFDRHLIPLLSGNNSRASVAEQMLEHFKSGKLQAKSDGDEIKDAQELLSAVTDEIQQRLRRYVEHALLIER